MTRVDDRGDEIALGGGQSATRSHAGYTVRRSLPRGTRSVQSFGAGPKLVAAGTRANATSAVTRRARLSVTAPSSSRTTSEAGSFFVSLQACRLGVPTPSAATFAA
jgi:hypothetical protein